MSAPRKSTSQAPAKPRAGHGDYRPDIDGLRAIAVLAVVLVHAHVAGFSGGFIGVDVFFVISGFLIFRNLDSAQKAGTFGFWTFYGRRLRRTLPALYLVAGVTFAVGAFLLMPGDYDGLARSLVAVLLFVPNILFLTQTGYFDHTAVSKPLLHTWSLGVEEQFYALAPLLPLALSRLGRKAPARSFSLSLFAAGLDFLRRAAEHSRRRRPSISCRPGSGNFSPAASSRKRSFHESHPAGSRKPSPASPCSSCSRRSRSFTHETPHPGLLTALPCLATAALIHIGGTKTTFVGRCLSHRVLGRDRADLLFALSVALAAARLHALCGSAAHAGSAARGRRRCSSACPSCPGVSSSCRFARKAQLCGEARAFYGR